jgi:signal peptidase II
VEPSGDVRAASANPFLFWGVIALVVILDTMTKVWAVYALLPAHIPHNVLGETFRFTLVYNPGAAFGVTAGEHSRWIFLTLTIVALGILWRMYVTTRDGAYTRVLALALVCGGALGNMIDRIRSASGVVDFIDIGIGTHRWPTFNVADMAVSTGAVLLAWILLQEDRAAARVVPAGDH